MANEIESQRDSVYLNKQFSDRMRIQILLFRYRYFPSGSIGKESTCNAGDPGLIPGLGRSPVEGNGNQLQYFLAWKIPWTEKPGGLQSMVLSTDVYVPGTPWKFSIQ